MPTCLEHGRHRRLCRDVALDFSFCESLDEELGRRSVALSLQLAEQRNLFEQLELLRLARHQVNVAVAVRNQVFEFVVHALQLAVRVDQHFLAVDVLEAFELVGDAVLLSDPVEHLELRRRLRVLDLREVRQRAFRAPGRRPRHDEGHARALDVEEVVRHPRHRLVRVVERLLKVCARRRLRTEPHVARLGRFVVRRNVVDVRVVDVPVRDFGELARVLQRRLG